MEECYTQTYPSGSKKYECTYKEGKLHGPSRYYSEEGVLLAESYFIEGKREGEVHWFYPSGERYSVQHYRHGVWDGTQEYWYKDGTLKTSMQYVKGTLKGKVVLNNPDGTLMRELHF